DASILLGTAAAATALRPAACVKLRKVNSAIGAGAPSPACGGGSRRRSGQEGTMELPPVDIAALPLLDTAVGLFGSLMGESATSGPSIFEIAVTIALIVHD